MQHPLFTARPARKARILGLPVSVLVLVALTSVDALAALHLEDLVGALHEVGR